MMIIKIIIIEKYWLTLPFLHPLSLPFLHPLSVSQHSLRRSEPLAGGHENRADGDKNQQDITPCVCVFVCACLYVCVCAIHTHTHTHTYRSKSLGNTCKRTEAYL